MNLDNNFDYQGKRRQQVKDSENFVFWAILGMIIMTVILAIKNL